MFGILKYRLKATILEPMIALMIILFSLTASFLIVVKAARQTNIQQEVRASAEIDTVITDALEAGNFLDGTYDNEGIRIVKEVTKYTNNEQLMVITVSAYNNRNKLILSRRIIRRIDK
jgi:uncharacterized membrane-anchored protein YitT (DUF2179 family)